MAAATVEIVRLEGTNADALRLLNEYYESVHVVQRDEPSSGIWLAYLNGTAVGCVVLRPLPDLSFAAECKRLYVQPQARGLHLADALLDAQEEYAVSRGIQWIYLDTYDDLQAAIALYKRRGFVSCPRYNDNPQATQFFRKQIGQRLSDINSHLPQHEPRGLP
jgi:ribosomal protein S18 acetylase RimI-like enzyme